MAGACDQIKGGKIRGRKFQNQKAGEFFLNLIFLPNFQWANPGTDIDKLGDIDFRN